MRAGAHRVPLLPHVAAQQLPQLGNGGRVVLPHQRVNGFGASVANLMGNGFIRGKMIRCRKLHEEVCK